MPRASKKDQLINTASRLFIENGYHATGIDRIIEEAGVARMTLYKHFKSKDDLIVAVLKKRDEDFRGWFINRIEEMAQDPKAQILASFDALWEWFSGKGLNDEEFCGCAFIKAASEYGDSDEPAHQAVEAHSEMMNDYFNGLVKSLGVHNVEELTDEIMLLQSGAVLTAQTTRDPAIAIKAKKAAERLITSSML